MRRHGNVIVLAYIDTGALEIACPNCTAEAGQWCQTSTGLDRRVPCVDRATARTTAEKATP